MATSEFDTGIAVSDQGDGRFGATLGQGWTIGAAVNGGHLLAVMGNALRHSLGTESGHVDPVTVSAYYLAAAEPGPARVETTVLRRGGRLSTGQASLFQGDEERIRALATYADLDQVHGETATTATPRPMPPVEECLPSSAAPDQVKQMAPLMGRFDFRFDPDSVGWTVGKPSMQGRMQAWARFADGRDFDPLSLLLLCDALPPTTMDLGLTGWAPTLELTVHVRARPAPGWVHVSHETRNLAGGLFEEDAEVWDSTGRLVAQSRQLALVPRG